MFNEFVPTAAVVSEIKIFVIRAKARILAMFWGLYQTGSYIFVQNRNRDLFSVFVVGVLLQSDLVD